MIYGKSPFNPGKFKTYNTLKELFDNLDIKFVQENQIISSEL